MGARSGACRNHASCLAASDSREEILECIGVNVHAMGGPTQMSTSYLMKMGWGSAAVVCLRLGGGLEQCVDNFIVDAVVGKG